MAETSYAPTVGGGRYLVLRRLGHGAQAVVLHVRDTRLSVDRAMKVLLPRFAAKPKVRARFAAEARAMARLEHPNIVRIYDVETEAVLPYLVMEYVPSGCLAEWVAYYGAFPATLAAQVALDLCAGVTEAHTAGIVHRDIKPHNVLVSTDGTMKLTDFGIARTEEGNRTRVGVALGTEGYMAPEQARNAAAADERSDVYSIGMTLFVLATGYDPLEWLAGRGGDAIPEPLFQVLQMATGHDPADRYQSVAQMAESLVGVFPFLPQEPVMIPLGTQLPSRNTETSDRVDDYRDIGELLDVDAAPTLNRRLTSSASLVSSVSEPSDPPSRATYVMWKPDVHERSRSTPDYIDRNSQANRQVLRGRRENSVVGGKEEEEWSSDEAVLRRASPITLFVSMAAVAALALGCLGVVVIGGTAGTVAVAVHQPPATGGYELHRAIDADQALFGDLTAMGSRELLPLLAAWREEVEPAKTQHALALVEATEREVNEVTATRATIHPSTLAQLARLQQARDRYQTRMRANAEMLATLP